MRGYLGIPDREQHTRFVEIQRLPPRRRLRRTRQAGASVYGESFCASCHAVQNAAGILVGGDVGPELTRIGIEGEAGMDAGMGTQSEDLRSANRDAALSLQRQAARDLAGFLLAKTDSDFLANVHLDAATPSRSRTARAWSTSTAVPRVMRSTGSRSRKTSRRS